MPQSSVIIPVFNGWELTRPCLKSLARTTQGQDIEVIVVDNGSSDATFRGAPALGKQLFGDKFRYLRNEQNRNFGPANNQAAMSAQGEYLVLLNNDTELLPGWHEKLLGDFQVYPDLAATGPLLVFPEQRPFGQTVQHLGVFVNPFWRVGHLHEGIPAASPLARKRRFFQAITAACLMIPRQLFLDAGMFDEDFANGFEDVDLCARIGAKGKHFTVNPEARVIHHESMSKGRNNQEDNNSKLYYDKCVPLFKPDMAIHYQNDDLLLQLTPWQTLRPALAPELEAECDARIAAYDYDGLLKALAEYPYWENGWRKLLALPEIEPYAFDLRLKFYRAFHSPFIAMENALAALRSNNMQDAAYWLETFEPYCMPIATYTEMTHQNKNFYARTGQIDLMTQAASHEANLDRFNKNMLSPLYDAAAMLRRKLGKA